MIIEFLKIMCPTVISCMYLIGLGLIALKYVKREVNEFSKKD